jgi:ribose-phosphate pyrophosphokinase
VLLAGTGNRELALNISKYLGVKPADMKLTRFSGILFHSVLIMLLIVLDGEVVMDVKVPMGGKDIFIVQPCSNPVNDNMMELLLMISCAKRCGAVRVTAVVPYFGYRYHRRGEPISTKNQSRFLWSASGDFSKMLRVMGVHRIIAVDLHRTGQGITSPFSALISQIFLFRTRDLLL